VWSKFFSARVLVCVIATVALAQDPTKVEPKHYKLDFENERVQVVHVHYGPHEKSVTHEHPAGVVVNLTEGHLKFTDENGKTQEVYAKPGEVRWFASPHKHKVENLSAASYNAVYIGVKGKSAIASAAPKADQQAERILMESILASLK
jgi:quercetin dioxygenase-like cupin family protein